MDVTSGIIGAVAGLLVTLIPVIYKAIGDKSKVNNDNILATNEQAVKIYAAQIEKMEARLEEVQQDLDGREERYLAAREQLVEFRIENRILKEKLEKLEAQLANKVG